MTEPPTDDNLDGLLGRLGKFVTGRPVQVLIAGGLLALTASIGAVQLPAACESAAGPSRGTQAARARQVFQEKFPSRTRVDTYVGVVALESHRKHKASLTEVEAPTCSFENVECTHKSWLGRTWPMLLQGVQEAMIAEQKSMERAQDEAPVLALPGIVNFSFDLNESLNRIHPINTFTSNATLWYGLGVPVSDGFVSKDGTSTIFLWSLRAKKGAKIYGDFADDAEDLWYQKVRKWLRTDEVDTGVISGSLTFMAAMGDAKRSMALMDMVAMPLASLVLWYVLQSARLLLFPLLTSTSSASIGFGIMFLVAQAIDVAMTTPTMMMSMTIAMSIDYSLFFLTRFRQELLASSGSGEQPSLRVKNAIHATMPTAGFAIMLSGFILCVSFSVIAIFPINLLSSMGIGNAVILVVMVMVHLTMGPALLALFPVFFSGCVSSDEAAAAASATDQAVAASGSGWSASRSGTAILFSRLARFTAKPWAGALTVVSVVALTCTYGYVAVDLETTADIKMLLPRHGKVFRSFELMEATFGAGNFIYFDVTMVVNSSYPTVMQQTPWEDSQRILQAMVERLPFMDGTGISSSSYFLGPMGSKATPWAAVQGCGALARIAPPPQCSLLSALLAEYVSKDNRAIYAKVSLAVDPLSARGAKFLHRARDLFDKLERSTCFNLYLSGAPVDIHDNIDKVMDLFPVMVIITFSAALLMLGVAFHSVVMPLRSLTSIMLTLLWVYGGAVRVFQHGVLDWLSWSAVDGKFGGQYWLMPVGSFSVVVGLCLDYDIFLLTRVTECREQGMTTQEAVEEGLCSTGGTITAAGLIMTIAFSGLLFCTDVAAMNVLGFYMVGAVLYDTLVVRCLMVPATMSCLGRWNWWPSELSSSKD